MLAWVLRLLEMVLVLPETAGSLLGMGVVGKGCVHIKFLGGLKKNVQKKCR